MKLRIFLSRSPDVNYRRKIWLSNAFRPAILVLFPDGDEKLSGNEVKAKGTGLVRHPQYLKI